MTRIGVMQGRLVPPVNGRIQAFPGVYWRDEFPLARKAGLSSIEWILESPLDGNPLWGATGLGAIREQTVATGIEVKFVCADYFMESPWVRMSAATKSHNRAVLKRLIEQAARLEVRGIEIPCVDASEIRTTAEEDELIEGLAPCLAVAEQFNIEIGLETSLPPERFSALLRRCGHPVIRANYDTGNSASLGYDACEEIEAYGRWINNVHIKDRVRGGTTVPLGTGDADIPVVLQALRGVGYAGGFILQAARQGNELTTVRAYRGQLESWLADACAENGSRP